jgi:protoheme IX farnesyltransferase
MILALARLVRPKVCLMVAAATATGYLLARPAPGPGLPMAVAASALLAAGCSAVNQLQERRQDALMRRTRNRPLPTGRLTPAFAGWAGAGFLGAAFALLAAVSLQNHALDSLAIACLVIVLYNGVYTPLKKVTPYCTLIGGLAGAAPPLLGFAAAGLSPANPRILAVALVMYLWQVPHFWLLAREHAGDYRSAGFAVAPRFRRGGLPVFAWISCLGAAMCLTQAITPARPQLAVIAAVAAASVVALAARLGKRPGFAVVNTMMGLFLALLAAQAVWPWPGFAAFG